ncbi:FAD-dependent oxidoreductase [Clostridium psychrophilum]|uniref:FAD-dependent oxidoreductase n=1 Tax=Clostridium psychrophilum TaxID=132926 RepID=UPI0035E4191B
MDFVFYTREFTERHLPCTADVLLGKKDCKCATVIVGGGLVGCELALHLAKKGKKVTIVEALNKILALNGPLCSANSEMLEKLIPFNNIDVKTNSKVKAYKDGLLEMETESGTQKIKCDSVILSVGYKELEFEVPEIYLLGDARKVSNIMYGIWDAYEVANHI